MSPTLTEQQRQALHETDDTGPVTVVDPATRAEYVLVRADVFHDLREWQRDMDPQEAYSSIDQIMADDDAHDPTLASYQDDSRSRWPT